MRIMQNDQLMHETKRNGKKKPKAKSPKNTVHRFFDQENHRFCDFCGSCAACRSFLSSIVPSRMPKSPRSTLRWMLYTSGTRAPSNLRLDCFSTLVAMKPSFDDLSA